MVVSSEPEKTRLEEAAKARTAPLCPVSVARHLSVFTSQTRTCRINNDERADMNSIILSREADTPDTPLTPQTLPHS